MTEGKERASLIATMMIEAILEWTPHSLQSVTLVDRDPAMVEAWRIVLSRHRT